MYGAGVMGVMARRWKGQWNENAKNWSFFDVLPELDHNAVVGFPHPAAARELLTIVMLRSGRDHERVALRFDITAELLQRAQIPVEQLRFDGANSLSEALQAVYLGDHVSYYLALLNGADPTPVEAIAFLKERLGAGR
jgi:glucose/mannose-6-phosphate isomerase